MTSKLRPIAQALEVESLRGLCFFTTHHCDDAGAYLSLCFISSSYRGVKNKTQCVNGLHELLGPHPANSLQALPQLIDTVLISVFFPPSLLHSPSLSFLLPSPFAFFYCFFFVYISVKVKDCKKPSWFILPPNPTSCTTFLEHPPKWGKKKSSCLKYIPSAWEPTKRKYLIHPLCVSRARYFPRQK